MKEFAAQEQILSFSEKTPVNDGDKETFDRVASSVGVSAPLKREKFRYFQMKLI